MVWKVVCRVLELWLASQIEELFWLFERFVSWTTKKRYWRLWGIHNDWQYQMRDWMYERWHWCRIPELVGRIKTARFIYRYWRGNAKGYRVQFNRSNISATIPLLYYKRSIGISFIDIPFLCRQLPVSKYFAESNIIINGQTIGMPASEQFESCHDEMPTPK